MGIKLDIKLFLLCSFTTFIYGDNEARLLLYGNCITCHHETKAISAPSLKEIQKRYKAAFPNKKEFVAYMSNWVYEPNRKSSLMDDMILKYEIMPSLGYDKEVLLKISGYIYSLKLQ